ncbi:MAG TPA: GAF domain-containing protein [Candidatus Binatia bacterium]|nr:GAF domain-containing protein [Candidatus Binatia bacterium]
MTTGRRGRRRPVPSPDVRLLGEATRTLGGTLDLARLMGRLTELAQSALGADAAGVWLLEKNASEMVLRGDTGFNRPEVVARVTHAPGRDVSAWLTERPGPLVLRRLPIGAAPEARGWLEAEEARSFLGVPLIGDEVPLGMLGLFRRRRRPFTAADLARAEALCMAVPPAILNARLYADQLARAERTAVLLAIAETLGATLDLPAALDDIAERAARALDAERCVVALWRDGAAPPEAPLGDAEAVRYRRPVEVDDQRLVVPIVRKGEPVGVLRFTARGRRRWERSAVDLASAIAGQIALVAENARLYSEAHARADELTALHAAERRRAEELAALLRAVRTMLGGLDTKTILESIVEEAAAIAGTPHVSLLLVDREMAALRLAAVAGDPAPPEHALSLGESYSGQVATSGAPVFVADTRDDPRNVLAARDREAGIVTYLGLPVKIRDSVVGVLAFHTTAPRRYSAHELAYLGSFADHAAIALDNGHLYDEAQRALADLRAMQERLVQGETLRALGELAGGAAHHLNNLLTVVVGRIQLLRRSVTEEHLARPLEIVERAAKDGAEVVRRLQQFAGMRRRTLPRAVRLDEIVADVLEMTRGRWQDAARAAGIEITVDTALGAVPPIAGDAAALRELLTNLVLNAVDALPAGGRVTIETRMDEGAVALAVTDTGVGMPDDVRRRAHEPFFTTKGVKATGLGLSVAYGIARRHGGELTLTSEPGRGTTALVRLPATAETERTAAPRPGERPGPLRILLVDDEEEVRRALAEMLASEGHAVVTAADGAEALRRLDADPNIELVVTDLVMPAMTGWELTVAVKARRPALPVGVITGWGDLPDSPAGGHAAVDFVLSKPVTLEALHDAIAGLPQTPR